MAHQKLTFLRYSDALRSIRRLERYENFLEIWTDGSKGGWSAIILGDHPFVVYGRMYDLCYPKPQDPDGTVAYRVTTQRCEMFAPIRALELLEDPSNIVIHSDSEYVVKGFNQYRFTWVARGWRKYDGSVCANVDLWKRLISASQPHLVQFEHVRGNAGFEWNETAHLYAEMAKFLSGERIDCVLGC